MDLLLDPELVLETTSIHEFYPIRCAELYNELVRQARDLAEDAFANRDPLPVPNSIPFSYLLSQNPGGRRYIDPNLVIFLQNCILYEEYPVDALLLPFVKPLDPRTFYMYHDWLSPRDADSVICLLALPADTAEGGLFFNQRTQLARMVQFPWPEGPDEAQHWMPLEFILRKWVAYWERGMIGLETDDEDLGDDGEDNSVVRMCWDAEEVYYSLMGPGHKLWDALLNAIIERMPAGSLLTSPDPAAPRRQPAPLQTAPANPHGTPFSPLSPLSPTSLLSQGLESTHLTYNHSPISAQSRPTLPPISSLNGDQFGPTTTTTTEEEEEEEEDTSPNPSSPLSPEDEDLIDSDEERARWNCPEGWYIHSNRPPVLRSGQPLRIAPGLVRPNNGTCQVDLDDTRQREKVLFAGVDEGGRFLTSRGAGGREERGGGVGAAGELMGLFYCVDDEVWQDRVAVYAFDEGGRRVRTELFEPVGEAGRVVRCPWETTRGLRLRDVLRVWVQCVVEGRWTVGPNGVEGRVEDLFSTGMQWGRVRWSRVEL